MCSFSNNLALAEKFTPCSMRLTFSPARAWTGKTPEITAQKIASVQGNSKVASPW
jgi:hypothetical protein